MAVTLIYDDTFDGLLTAIFEVYEYRFSDPEIVAGRNFYSENIFAEKHQVITEPSKAARVLFKIEQNLGKSGCSDFLKLFFSEHPKMEQLFFHAVKSSLQNPSQNIFQNLADDPIMEISKILKSMRREIHRMHAFIRFERLQDDLYFAKIEPDFNVLPLIFKHFKARYADQRWMIVDLKRNFGVAYDLNDIDFFVPEAHQIQEIGNSSGYFHEEENHFQKMWQSYFVRTGIASRKNIKLHIQHVPKRYWKYLTEKV